MLLLQLDKAKKSEKLSIWNVPRRLLKRLMPVSTFLCLGPFLVSCTTPAPQKPNPLLTQDCEYPVLSTDTPTYRDVVVLAEQRGQALTECNTRLQTLRDSYE